MPRTTFVESRGQQVAAKSDCLLRAILATPVEDELLVAMPCTLRGAADEWSAERPVFSVEQVLSLADDVPEPYRAAVLLGASCCLGGAALPACDPHAGRRDRGRTVGPVVRAQPAS